MDVNYCREFPLQTLKHWLIGMPRRVMASHVGLGAYVSSCAAHDSNTSAPELSAGMNVSQSMSSSITRSAHSAASGPHPHGFSVPCHSRPPRRAGSFSTANLRVPHSPWPLPPPFPWSTGRSPVSNRRRARWRQRRSLELMVNLTVCCLSYSHLHRLR